MHGRDHALVVVTLGLGLAGGCGGPAGTGPAAERGADAGGVAIAAPAPESAARLLLQGDGEAALVRAREAAAARPREAKGFLDLASAALATGRLDEAIEAARAGVRLAPDQAGAYVLRGLVHARRGELIDAERSWQEALARRPTTAEARAARLQLAALARDKGDLAATATLLEAAVSAEPEDATLRAELALARAGAGDATGAREAAREAVARDPGRGEAQRLLAALAWDASEHAETLERAVIALRINPRDEVAERLLEGALLVVGSARLQCERGPEPDGSWPLATLTAELGVIERRFGFEGIGRFMALRDRLGDDEGLRGRVDAEVRATCGGGARDAKAISPR
jgi:tetratricopeptide (TPR) repeat protein